MKEVNSVKTINGGHRVCGISCDPGNSAVWICGANFTAVLEKGQDEFTYFYNDDEDEDTTNKWILALPSFRLTACVKDTMDLIAISPNQGTELRTIRIFDGYAIEGMCLFPEVSQAEEDGGYCIYLLLSHPTIHGIYYSRCTLQYGGASSAAVQPSDSDSASPENLCEPRDDSRSRYHLLNGIAREESRIAQELQLSGEKLKNIVACSQNTDELLHSNEALRRRIAEITELEKDLLEKLEVAARCCGPDPM